LTSQRSLALAINITIPTLMTKADSIENVGGILTTEKTEFEYTEVISQS